MAKITDLAVTNALTGDEFLPIVQGGATKRATLTALRALITPFLQYWYKGDKGDTGPAQNTYTSYAALLASDPTRRYAYLSGDTDASPQPDGAFSNPSGKAGGWARQSAAGISASQPGFPAIVRSLGDALPYINGGEFFGIKSDGATDDTAKLAAAILAVSNNSRGPGGVLNLRPGGKTITSSQTIVRPDVHLAINGGEIEAHLSGGNDAALVPMSYATIRGGKVKVISTGNPGIQAGAHAPIRVGPAYDEAGPVSNPSELCGAVGWTLLDLIVTSDKLISESAYPLGIGASGIQIYGDARSGTVGNCEVLSSSRMSAGLQAEWIPQGGIISAAGSMTSNKQKYLAGTGRTLHPRNIDIWGLRVGRLSRAGSSQSSDGAWALRLSGAQAIRARGIEVDSVTSAALCITPGDIGFEYAEDAVRRLGMRGIVIDGFQVVGALSGVDEGGGDIAYLAWLDCDADNLRAAIAAGYDNMTDPQVKADLIVRNLVGRGDGTSKSNDGVRCNRLHGAKLEQIIVRNFKRGILIDDSCKQVSLFGSTITNNRSHGVEVAHANAPEDVHIFGNTIAGNGTAGSNTAGIFLGSNKRAKVYANTFGSSSGFDPYQTWGLRVDGVMEGVEIGVPARNTVLSTKAGGVGESLFNDVSDYGKLAAYHGALAPNMTYVSALRGGIGLVPVSQSVDSDGVTRSDYRASNAAAPAGIPTAGAYVIGDTLTVEETGLRTRCSAGGSPGTWTA